MRQRRLPPRAVQPHLPALSHDLQQIDRCHLAAADNVEQAVHQPGQAVLQQTVVEPVKTRCRPLSNSVQTVEFVVSRIDHGQIRFQGHGILQNPAHRKAGDGGDPQIVHLHSTPGQDIAQHRFQKGGSRQAARLGIPLHCGSTDEDDAKGSGGTGLDERTGGHAAAGDQLALIALPKKALRVPGIDGAQHLVFALGQVHDQRLRSEPGPQSQQQFQNRYQSQSQPDCQQPGQPHPFGALRHL